MRPTLAKNIEQQDNDEALNKLVNQIEDTLAGGSSLSETASQFKLKLNTFGPATKEGGEISGKKIAIPALDKFLETGFKTEEKTESPVMTSKGGIYYILRVENITPEHLLPLKEVHEQAVNGLQHQQKAIKLAEIATKAGEEFAGNTSKAPLIAKYKLQSIGNGIIKRSTHVAHDISLPSQLVTDIFSRKPGEGTLAYLTNNGVYLLAISQSAVPMGSPEKDTRLATSLADIKHSLQTAKQNEIMEEYTQYLRTKFAVQVNEDVFRTVTN